MAEEGKRGMTGKHGNHRTGEKVPRVDVVCEVCGNVRKYLESQIRVRGIIKYCSRECSYQGNKKPYTWKEVNCAYCGKETLKRADHLKINKNSFCSKECKFDSRKKEDAKWRDPAKIKEYMQYYQKENRERINALSQARVKRDKEGRKATQKRYRAKNAEKISFATRARRANAKAGDFTPKMWSDMKEKYGHKCLRCGSFGKLEIDHIIPVSKGGAHNETNIQPLCRSCNSSKGNKCIDYRTK